MQDDLKNTFYFRQFLILYSFVYAIIEIAKLTPEGQGPTVLGILEQKQY
jgi:hypothetical protein